MPKLVGRDIHVDSVLTNFSLSYAQKMSNYSVFGAAPVLSVGKQSDRYYITKKGALLRDEAQILGLNAESAGSSYELDNTPTYFCDPWAIHKDTDDQILANSDSILRPLQSATYFVTQQLMTRAQRLFNSTAFTGSAWDNFYYGQGGGSLSGSTNFVGWNLSTSDPFVDISNARNTVQLACGTKPNVGVVSGDVFETLCNNAKVTSRHQFFRQSSNADELASMFKLDRLIVDDSIYSSGKEGASVSMARNLSNGMLLLVVPKLVGIDTLSALTTFAWSGLEGGSAGGEGSPYIQIRNFRIDEKHTTRVEGVMPIDIKVTAADAGIFLDNIIVS